MSSEKNLTDDEKIPIDGEKKDRLSLTDILMGIARGEIGQVKMITQQLNSQNKIYASELNITDAVPNAELIKELIEAQIGGEKDWC